MSEPGQKPPQQRDLSGPLHAHLGEAAKPVVKDGYIRVGTAARDQAEAGGGSSPNPPAPSKGPVPPKAEGRPPA